MNIYVNVIHIMYYIVKNPKMKYLERAIKCCGWLLKDVEDQTERLCWIAITYCSPMVINVIKKSNS